MFLLVSVEEHGKRRPHVPLLLIWLENPVLENSSQRVNEAKWLEKWSRNLKKKLKTGAKNRHGKACRL